MELRFILATLAVYRLARLFTLEDGPLDIFLKARESAAVCDNPLWQTIAKLFNCPYCLGIWFAAAAAVVVMRPTLAGDAILIWLALAGAQSILQSHDW